MPALNISKDDLLNQLEANGIKIEEKKLEEIVFDFGVELDEIYIGDGRTMYKFDIPANRYDLLCFEGFSNAISCFLSLSYIYKQCDYLEACIDQTVINKGSEIRPHIACALIKGISFNDRSLESFISYQDKLHYSLGRNRSLVAIGTHDYSKIKGRITYKTTGIRSIVFQPLGCSTETCINLEEYFEKDKKISKYFSLLPNKDESVAFFDDEGIISIPPIINSERTKITKETTDVFVEITGTDFNKVNIALNLILSNFPGQKIQKFMIKKEEGVIVTPVLNNQIYKIIISDINRKLKLNLKKSDISALLKRVMYNVLDSEDDVVSVYVPVFRSDVLHECDIIEDIAIAYGFNNFEIKMPTFYTLGSENQLNKFSDKIRLEMALSGFNEVLTLTLLPEQENRLFLDCKNNSVNSGSIPEYSDYFYDLNDVNFNEKIMAEGIVPRECVILSNPKSKEYEVVRTTLLPGVLKALNSNLHIKIPIKIFEVSDVVIKKSDFFNIKKFCGLIASSRSMLEELQGPLSLVLEKCGIDNYKYIPMSIDDSENIYLSNQSAWVSVNNIIIGSIGVLHPKICNGFGIPYACSSFEIDIQLLLKLKSQ